jgi:hypothetical protein
MTKQETANKSACDDFLNSTVNQIETTAFKTRYCQQNAINHYIYYDGHTAISRYILLFSQISISLSAVKDSR